MKKDLPNLYRGTVSKKANNKDFFHVKDNNVKTVKEVIDYGNEVTVEEKLYKLFKSSRYIFNIKVEIKTSKKTYDTKIAGKVKNSIVTIDGETIPIIEIEDIIIKDRL